MEFRSQRKLRHRKLKGRKFTFCDFTAFFAGDVLLWSAYNTREELSKSIGVFDKRFDTDNTLLSKHLYIIKDLRNAIAHNRPIFDCRFRTSRVKGSVIKHLEAHTATRKINFQTITDYVLLIAYYMRCFNFTKSETKNFLMSYKKLVMNYQKKSNNSSNFRKIFDVDSVSKIQKFIAIT